MKPGIYFRTDGSREIGLGHLVRCTALAQMLIEDFSIAFFCREIPESMVKDLENNKISFALIADENEFLTAVEPGSLVVLDGYHFDSDYQKQIKASGARLICIDDLHEMEFAADLIVNQAPGIEPRDYSARPYTQYALGTDYALLRPAFLDQAKKPRNIEKIETVMICFGGSDPKNLTQSVLRVAQGFRRFKKIIVVTGYAYRPSDTFNQLVAGDIRIEHRHALNEWQMLETMVESDLAIVPASGILMEVIASGCAVISGSYVDNQNLVHENFIKSGHIADAGDFSDEKVHDALERIFRSGPSAGKCIDGLSASRFIRLFKQLHDESSVKLRQAVGSDLNTTYRWASDPEVRRYSFQQNQITGPEHSSWFSNKLADPDSLYCIAEFNGIAVGSIRFDIREREAIISYLVDPAFHGRGFGIILLKKGIEWLLQSRQDAMALQRISGEVMKTNIPSIKAFERLGFTKTDQNENFKFEKWVS